MNSQMAVLSFEDPQKFPKNGQFHASVFLNFLLCLFIHQSHSIPPSHSLSLSGRYFESLPSYLRKNKLSEYTEITRPLPSDEFSPSCSLLQQDFSNTIGCALVTANYSPPSDCPAPWSHVVLELRASCCGEQYDRITRVWLDGVDILQTRTAEPTDSGIIIIFFFILPSSPSHSSSSLNFEFTISLSPCQSSSNLCPADELFYEACIRQYGNGPCYNVRHLKIPPSTTLQRNQLSQLSHEMEWKEINCSSSSSRIQTLMKSEPR